MSEQSRVEVLRGIFGVEDRRVRLGIGDDAAVLAPSTADRVCTVDASIEHVHFERAWLKPYEVGYRATMAAASDVAAMGGSVDAFLIALALPDDVDDNALADLARGIRAAADTTGGVVVGGNLARGTAISVTTTVIGTATNPWTRAGAKPGDLIFVTGTPGSAALGLEVLRHGLHESAATIPFIDAWKRPRARLDIAKAVTTVHAAVDISDGLVTDLAHLARASGVAARISVDSIPIAPGARDVAGHIGVDIERLSLGGGEAYELLLAVPPDSPVSGATQIGTIIRGEPGAIHVTDRSIDVSMLAGYDHFR